MIYFNHVLSKYNSYTCNQQVSRYCKGFIGIAAVLLAVFVGLSFGTVVTWLTFVYVCSYVKLAITLIKYVPQV